jgi:dephospho-CoA kinase
MQTKRSTLITLTGGLAAGKSSAAEIFRSLGAEIIDTDQLARSLLSPSSSLLKKVTQHFGNEILMTSGEVNRRKLREIIFQRPEERTFLENLLHPAIRRAVEAELKSLLSRVDPPLYIIVVVPLLKDKHAYPSDVIVTIEVPHALQINRVIERDQISESLAFAMIEAQPSSQHRQALADYVIWNTGDKEVLRGEIEKILKKIPCFHVREA